MQLRGKCIVHFLIFFFYCKLGNFEKEKKKKKKWSELMQPDAQLLQVYLLSLMNWKWND